ncbi:MAG: hypothetical protein ABSB87_20685 [Terriglobales bacterium]
MSMCCTRIRFACFVVLIFACICSCWCQQSPNGDGKTPSFFVVVPGATGVTQSIFQGKDQIIYHVQSEYPADNVLSTISARLKKLGWEPLREDWLNPGLPSSHIRGWTYFEDETTKPATSVRAWGAQWENGDHDILEYSLEYRCPGNLCSSTYDLHDLRVVAIRVPADLAKRMKAAIPEKK